MKRFKYNQMRQQMITPSPPTYVKSDRLKLTVLTLVSYDVQQRKCLVSSRESVINYLLAILSDTFKLGPDVVERPAVYRDCHHRVLGQ